MRRYTLASISARDEVDLRDFQSLIEETVHEFLPTAKVVVAQDYYTVAPEPDRGNAIRIGRRLCQAALGKHCVQIPKLFNSQKIEEETKEETKHGTEKCHGGHL